MIFNIFLDVSDSFVINTKLSSVTVTLKICLFEMKGQILWLGHCRDIFLWNRKTNSVTVTPEIRFSEFVPNFWTKNCVLWIVVGSKKLSCKILTINGLDKYSVSK